MSDFDSQDERFERLLRHYNPDYLYLHGVLKFFNGKDAAKIIVKLPSDCFRTCQTQHSDYKS